MFPSLRGGNDNPGQRESFFGEVDDILAAREFLAKQEYVDPARIYLGGHSTGGTLVLLVAECSEHQFRAVFSFGPVEDVEGYGSEYLHLDTSNRRELELRSPIRWLNSIKTPVFVFEGVRDGNLDSLQKLQAASTNPKLHFFPVRGADHFSVLSPLNRMIATRILNDTGATTNLAFTEADVLKAGK